MINDASKPEGTHVLPVVAQMCDEIGRRFARYVGPIGKEICAEVFEEWAQTGKTGPSGVTRFIEMLAENIPDERQRAKFERDARECVTL